MAHPLMFDEDDPFLARLRTIAGAFPGCFEKVSHGRPHFRAGEKGKVFAYFGGTVKRPDGHEPHDAGLLFKPDPSETEALRDDPRFWSPAYLGPFGWLGTDLDGPDVDWDEVTELVDASYRQVASRTLLAELDSS